MADQLFAVGSFTESYAGFRAAGEGLSLVRLREDGRLDIGRTVAGWSRWEAGMAVVGSFC